MTNGLDDQLQKVMSLSNQHRDKEVALRRKKEEEEGGRGGGGGGGRRGKEGEGGGGGEGRENGGLLASFPGLPVFAFRLHSQ